MIDKKRQYLLTEYESAQDSAQHHDSLLWNIIGIIWGAQLVLLGLIIHSIESILSKPIVISSSVLAIVLLLYLFFTFLSLRNIRNFKYSRCKEIELELGLKQHSSLNHPRLLGTIAFFCVMLFFVGTWTIVIFSYLF